MSTSLPVPRDYAASWTSANPTLDAGQVAVERDTQKVKMGDGVTAWTSLPYWPAAGGLLASTGVNGYSLVNGTGTILSWAVPNDGNLHLISFYGQLVVTSTETGGAISLVFNDPGGTSRTRAIFAAGAASGMQVTGTPTNFLVGANQTVTLTQSSALTAGGPSVLYAVLAGS